MKRIVFEFPDDASAQAFLVWFSDGTGEQDFMRFDQEVYAPDDGRDPITRFTYERAFPAWGYDPAKHGPDLTVTAHSEDHRTSTKVRK